MPTLNSSPLQTRLKRHPVLFGIPFILIMVAKLSPKSGTTCMTRKSSRQVHTRKPSDSTGRRRGLTFEKSTIN
ncbi:hypothetical protein L210DRAFT_3712534 [Boletus edulis BED1]|uniref:Uncharacterized protein n=1 Tax=Boletus edulis BED1 TaxID=1328754 RepID=A0AAD4GK07_BOLED|nr:hypothetical protein L210DRAFT_3712534 [Boletus edulis BED1]